VRKRLVFFVLMLTGLVFAQLDAVWSDTVRLTNVSVNDIVGSQSMVVDPSGVIHVVWESERGGIGYEIWYKRFYPGSGWTHDTCIVGELAGSYRCTKPTIAVDSSGILHLVFVRAPNFPPPYLLCYKKCTPTAGGNGGWDTAVTVLSPDSVVCQVLSACIACTPDGKVHVLYSLYRSTPYFSYSLIYVRKENNVWNPPVTLDHMSETTRWLYHINLGAGRDGNVHVSWTTWVPTNNSLHILYRGQFNGTWGATESIARYSGSSSWISMAVNPVSHRPGICFCYYPNSYTVDIYFKERSGNRASDTWPDDFEVVVSGDTYVAGYDYSIKSVYTREGRLHLANIAIQRGTNYNLLRYTTRPPAGGWDVPIELLYVPTRRQRNASIANGGNSADPASVHIVWSMSEYNYYNYDLYYIKGTNPFYDLKLAGVYGIDDTLGIGETVTPAVRVVNNGNQDISAFSVTITIGTSYTSTVNVNQTLGPGDSLTVTGFANWQPLDSGLYHVRAALDCSQDMLDENNTIESDVRVGYIDAAVTAIIAPERDVRRGTTLKPRVRIANYGDWPGIIDLRFVIYYAGNPVYDQTEQVEINPLTEVDHEFATSWTAELTGSYQAVAMLALAHDQNHHNDTARLNFSVYNLYPAGWKEVANVLGLVKDGGFVVKDPDGGKLYAARGYKTGDFYAYDIDANAWTALPAAPAIIGKGGNGCYGNGYVYVMHGQNTAKFSRFNIAANSWEALPDIPPWTSGKNPKGGGDLAYAEVDGVPYVYVLKGYKQDFGRYNLVTGTWEELGQAPAGAKPKWDKGSWLTYDGVNTLYAHKAKYSELWTFALDSSKWSSAALPGIPYPSTRTGKNKKPKDGSDGVYYNGFLYALKGGNTCEFWKYDISGGTGWTELDLIPEVGTTGKKKRVKNGGSLASNGDGAFFALKGGKTMEFWRYFEEPTVFASAPERSGVMGQTVTPVRFGFSVAPNPVVKGYGMLSYSVPQAGEAKVKVFDVTGRTVAEFGFVAQGTGTKSLDLRNLSAGIYLVKFEAAGRSASQKLIVQ